MKSQFEFLGITLPEVHGMGGMLKNIKNILAPFCHSAAF